MHRRLFWFWLAMFVFVAIPAKAQDSLLSTLQQFRKDYPTPMSKAQVGELLTRTAASKPGWVLLAKPQGNNCPAMGVKVSCDYLVWAATGQGFDVLRDSEGDAEPIWGKGDSFKSDRFVAVNIAPPDPPVVEPPAVPVSAQAQLDNIEKQNAVLIYQLLDVIAFLKEQQSMIAEIRKQQIDDRADVVNWLKEQQANNDGSGRAWWQILLGLGR